VRAGNIGASGAYLAAGAERFSQANVLDQDVYQLQDNVSYQLNNQHRVVVGTSNEFFRFRNLFLQAAIGVWSFDSLDLFEAGTANAFQKRYGPFPDLQTPGESAFRVNQWGFYVQDEWTPMSNLRITPGVRIDVPYVSKAPTNPALVDNAAFPIDTGKMPSGNILWSPRIGFNYSLDEEANTVLRGGVGIFSGRPPYVWVSNAYSINGLTQIELTCTGANVPTFTADPNAQPDRCKNQTAPPGAPVNQGEIDYFAPDTKYPQNLKVALGLDRRLPYGLVGALDFLFSNEVNGWYTTDENLTNRGADVEGRELYGTIGGGATTFTATPTRKDGTRLAQAVKVFNKNGAQVLSGTAQLTKAVAQVFAVTAGYTYTKAMDRISLTSSQALSNFQFAPLDGTIEERALRPSAFDRTHRIVIIGTASLPYGFGAGVSYTGQSGTPYTYLTANDVNGDGQVNDLVFVPAEASQIRLANAAQWDALNTFIEKQDCLKNARGRFVQRGECRNPWEDFLDMRFTWTSPKIVGEQRVEIQWDIFNVLNLVNPNWGRRSQVAAFENGPSFLRATGYDATQRRPIYTFTAPSGVSNTVLSPTSSRWRMQFGARYTF
jgi:hypothetical protein